MAALVFCSACNKSLDPAATTCPHCGVARTPGAPSGGSSSRTAVIVTIVVVSVFVFIAVIGILAAIAIPAYQDYTLQAKTSAAIAAAGLAKAAVAEYVADQHELPDSLEALELDAQVGNAELDLDADSGAIVITMLDPPLEGQSFALEPALNEDSTQVTGWSCHAIDIKEKYLPSQCRTGERL